MENTPLTALIATWSAPARDALLTSRRLFHQISEDRGLGPLDEALKWGQPAWRPVKPRTGSTLRLDWSDTHPKHLAVYVDCKTDLAARMHDLYPDLAENDLRRRMSFALDAPFPEQALSHLADMTFAYHLNKRATT